MTIRPISLQELSIPPRHQKEAIFMKEHIAFESSSSCKTCLKRVRWSKSPITPQPCWPYRIPKIIYCPPALRWGASPLRAPTREISNTNLPAWTSLTVKRHACGNVRVLEHLGTRAQVPALSHLGPGGLDVLLCPSWLLFIPAQRLPARGKACSPRQPSHRAHPHP